MKFFVLSHWRYVLLLVKYLWRRLLRVYDLKCLFLTLFDICLFYPSLWVFVFFTSLEVSGNPVFFTYVNTREREKVKIRRLNIPTERYPVKHSHMESTIGHYQSPILVCGIYSFRRKETVIQTDTRSLE